MRGRGVVRGWGLAVLAAGVAAICLLVGASGAAARPTITEFTNGLQAGNASVPSEVGPGPDGNVWFTDESPAMRAIGRITPSGSITEFSSGLHGVPGAITRGPDGNVWFTEQASAAVGRATPAGMITEYSAGLPSDSIPSEIVAGPDGNVWFTDRSNTKPAIGRITSAGTIHEFTAGLKTNSQPYGIALGADGNVWFTDFAGPAIGRITPSGHITEYTSGLQSNSFLTGMCAGPDGNVWFTDRAGPPVGGPPGVNAVGRITPAGKITEFTAGLAQTSDPNSITRGSDGNLWFADFGDAHSPQLVPAIGRVTPQGRITEYSAGLQPAGASMVQSITQGPDGNIWFVDQGGTHAIGRLALNLPPAVSTGPASSVMASSASVSGSVNPVGGAVSAIIIQYGPATHYGKTVHASPAALPAGGVPISIIGTLAHLTPNTTIHYRVVATNPFGMTPGADRTLKTPAVTPRLTHARESHRTWREGQGLPHLARKLALGTTFTFALNEPAKVALVFFTAKGHKHRGELSVQAHAGHNKLFFQGMLTRSRKLKPGRYSVVITAAAGGRHSTPVTLKFRIAKK